MKRLSFPAVVTIVLLVLMPVLLGLLATPQPVVAATVQTCERFGTVDINGKVYEVQANEWNSTLPQCLSVDDVSGAFTLTTSNPNLPTNGPPATYPSIFKGCHWGNCTNNSGMPVQVSAISTATTSWSTTQPSSGVYDVAYDIWFNSTPTTTGQPDGAELMIWINHLGSIQPVGSRVASGVSIGGTTWDVWFGNTGWNVISYVRTAGTTSVSNLDIRPFVNDGVSRGDIRTNWFLIAVEAGFEVWQGGVGLATNSFSATVAGGGGGNPTNTPTRTPMGPSPTPTRTPTRTNTPTGPSPTPSRTPTQTTGATCQVTYTFTNQWSTGFQASVDVRNTSSTTINGWTLRWAFPNGQTITQLWNATFTQTGANVSATNLSWNATIAPNATVNVGFTANSSGTNNKPTSFTLNNAACAVTP